MWMWSQGDAYRSRRKEVAMEKEKYRERHHSVTNLLSGVDDMRIHDAVENDNRFSNYDNVSSGIICKILQPFGWLSLSVEIGFLCPNRFVACSLLVDTPFRKRWVSWVQLLIPLVSKLWQCKSRHHYLQKSANGFPVSNFSLDFQLSTCTCYC